MDRLKLHQLDQSGATDGQSAVWSDADNAWVPETVSGGGSVAASAVTFTPTGGIASTDVQAALAEVDTEKAPLASPVFTGNPTAPTPTAGDNDLSIATTAFVQAAITALIGGAPGALDTLKELADAINDDASYAATITAALALKAPLASPALTGNPTVPTQTAGTNSTRAASTAYADNAVAKQPEVLLFALSDEATPITTGTKLTFRMPFAFTISQIRASLTTASSSGTPTVDVKKNGTSVFSTLLTIDATEKTSQTAATAAVLSTTAVADDDEIALSVTVAGTGAAGLKVTIIGVRA